ncbi:tetratricopeptide repeat protein [Lentzea sp. BCCO 10_0856]|uniref:Tetratricopeptide repeat protein n=1 Tax=Lentzea miocenica TaxID=3095431 RepID=A0ABU4T541_9PSEU|nr:tetratricopeptide repeat protein [Lentzea sp. BCCO 10_0856]MDX8033276.1 tetratricopeptide repeat protein [Lentzea sp. BCCO 10_0856]
MRPDEQPQVSSELSGSAFDVVQARDVEGGIHFHGSREHEQQRPSQLPGGTSGFVNRLHELTRLNEVLEHADDEFLAVGVYVITGTAGVGKTSLALHWAHSVRRHFADGQLYVNLRGYDPGAPVTAEQALHQFLRALGVPADGIPVALEDRSAMFRSLLADRRVLIILDNAANPGQVRPLLPGSATCLVLVTSRNRFSGLVARDGAQRLVLDMLTEDEAVRLLRTVTANYRVNDEASDLVELARLCARLPLALRIAAERASSRPLMMLHELIDDLRDESALWDALAADQDDESDAVRTVFAWSYRALPAAAARLFCLLGLHPGPEFSVNAAAALGGLGLSSTRKLLDVLIGAHVLEQHAPNRFQFHDLLRIYAAQQAFQHEDATARRDALERGLGWYLHTLSNATTIIAPLDRRIALAPLSANTTPLHFENRADAVEWYESERANLVAAVRAAASVGQDDIAWQLPVLLRSIYISQNPFEDWIETSSTGLKAAERIGDLAGQGEVLDSLGKAYLQSQRLPQAAECHSRALAIRMEIGDRYGEMVSVNALGLLDWRSRRLTTAVEHFRQCLEIAHALGDRRWQALAMTNLGCAQYDLMEIPTAVDALSRSVVVYQDIGDRAYEGNALFYLAMAQRENGELDAAAESIERALAIADEDHHVAWEAFWLVELGRIQRARGDVADSLLSYQRSVVAQRRLNDRNREAQALDGAGEAYRELGRAEEAEKFHRTAVSAFRETADRWSLARALTNLTLALNDSERPEQAAATQQEAIATLAEFDEPRARQLVTLLQNTNR